MKHTHSIEVSHADISVRPAPIYDPFAGYNLNLPQSVTDTEWTLPAMHGNVVKLLYSLSLHGLINIQPKVYDAIASIYYKSIDQLTVHDIITFKKYVSEISVIDQKSLVRLFGMLANKGQNDYFSLYLIAYLINKNLNIEILLTDHDYEFIRAYEAYFQKGEIPRKYEDLDNKFNFKSLNNMIFLLENMWISTEEVGFLYENYYRQKIKLLSYSLNKESNKISLYSYGPMNMEDIKALADDVHAFYYAKNAEAFAQTIDRMNGLYYVNTIKKNLIGSTGEKGKPVSKLIQDHTSVHLKQQPKEFKIKYVIGSHVNGKRGPNVYPTFETLGDNIFHQLGRHRSLCYVYRDVKHQTHRAGGHSPRCK